MSYYFNIKVEGLTFDEALKFLTEELHKEGFGVISEIDMKETLKTKLNLNFRKYKILGACSPSYAYRALHSEDNIGLLLPCNFVIQEHENGEIEIAAADPVASMYSVENEDLAMIANQIQRKIRHVVKALQYGVFHN
tara:strand:- start:40274 stop:40684 length:411 start_codon:yes stop_codon:yes gene_type:complete